MQGCARSAQVTISRQVSFALAAATALCMLVSAPARAQVQDPAQQSCINTMNKAGAKVAQAQGKSNASCVKDIGRGIGNVDTCMASDPRGKVAAAQEKAFIGFATKCLTLPSFGVTDDDVVNSVTVEEEIRLVRDVFGNPANPAIIDADTDSAGASCQASVAKAFEKVSAAALREFVSCKKRGLKTGTIIDPASLADCVGVDSGKVASAAAKLSSTVSSKCASTDLAIAFPGCGVGTASALADCAATAARCRSCIIAERMDDVTAPCDEVDNAILDGSCQQCGNAFVDDGEDCDEGPSGGAECDGDCTFAVCGDDVINTTAGEECEDDNTVETDSCTTTCRNAVCGDGIVCSDASCTSGPSGGPEQCDLGAENGMGLCSPSCELPPADPQCPNRSDVTLFAGTGRACLTNADCPIGSCDSGIGYCTTPTALDTGYTGIAHDGDINDEYGTRNRIACPGPNPSCGECLITGLDSDQPGGICRCANNNRTICDEPFEADADDCAGAVCNCYFGAPLPLSSGNTPACALNRFARDITGTTNVDTGEGESNINLRSQVFLGESIIKPCPSCEAACSAPTSGKCTAGLIGFNCTTNANCDILPGTGVCTPPKVGQACSTNTDCDIIAGDGVCSQDTPRDGIRNGVCSAGANHGASCDVNEENSTFPAPGGGGHSLDCFPSPGKNVSGSGLIIDIDSTTGSQSLSSGIQCGFPPGGPFFQCPCGVCSLDDTRPCSSNGDCLGYGTCGMRAAGVPVPNQCDIDGLCNDVGGGEGECNLGPDNKACDGLTRANGEGFIQCASNVDCSAANIGVAAGNCTLTERRECFLDPIVAVGATADPNEPLSAAVFCVPPTANAAINTVAGIPGPGRVVNQTSTVAICPGGTAYTPGGSCP